MFFKRCFVIAISFITISAVYSQNIETKIACEGQSLKLECRKDEMITILSANYGRSSTAVCTHQDKTNCLLPRSLDIMKSKCNSKQSCVVMASNSVFGDPCPRVIKYLEVKFKCVKAPRCPWNNFKCDDGKCVSNSTICDGVKDCAGGEDEQGCDYKTAYGCEGGDLYVECGKAELIRVVNGDYGRTNSAICKSNGNVNCRSPVARYILKDRCDLRRSCSVPVNNNVFGDPCPGVPKYAELHYKCWPIPLLSYEDLFRYYLKSGNL